MLQKKLQHLQAILGWYHWISRISLERDWIWWVLIGDKRCSDEIVARWCGRQIVSGEVLASQEGLEGWEQLLLQHLPTFYIYGRAFKKSKNGRVHLGSTIPCWILALPPAGLENSSFLPSTRHPKTHTGVAQAIIVFIQALQNINSQWSQEKTKPVIKAVPFCSQNPAKSRLWDAEIGKIKL